MRGQVASYWTAQRPPANAETFMAAHSFLSAGSELHEFRSSGARGGSALLSGDLLPFLACLGKRNGDCLLAAFHLASLAAAPALSAAALVAVHLAAHFFTRA